MQIVPINTGFYNFKSLNNQIFRSRLMVAPYDSYMTNSDTLCYDDTFYVVGAGDPQLEMNKLKDNFQLILVLNMLARFTKKEKESFKLLLSTPPIVYYSPQFNAKVYSDYFKGKHNVVWNTIHKEITIEECEVVPETFVAFGSVNSYGEYSEGETYIIDIGGYATNICRIKNEDFNEEDYITVQNGMYHLDQSVSQKLNQMYINQNLNSSWEDIENYRKNGLYHDDFTDENLFKKSRPEIEEIENKYIKELLMACKVKKWNLKAGKVVVIGGGGEALYPTIRDNFLKKAQLSKTAIWDNLLGLSIMANFIFQD